MTTAAHKPIVTLTLNPALDISTTVDRVESEHKLRCGPSQVEAGGGGINAARVMRRLGGHPVAIYAAGGVVQWEQALVMMIAATAGGYGGARLARRIPPEWLRAGIVLTGLVMAGVFFWRQ